MEMMYTYISLFYGLIAVVLIAFSFFIRPTIKGWSYYILFISGFVIGGLIFEYYPLSFAALLAMMISLYRLRQHIEKNRPLEIILVPDRDDYYLNYFLDYYRKDISKYFPRFDFKIEDEFLVALLISNMETVGLIIAEIRDKETLKICLDYMVPRHRNSQLAKTFYQCDLQCIDFLDYHKIYIEPQSTEHNNYLKRIGFKLVDGKYIVHHAQ